MDLKCSQCGAKIKILDKKVFPCARCELINHKRIWFFIPNSELVDIWICKINEYPDGYPEIIGTGNTILEEQHLKHNDIIHYRSFTHGDPETKIKVIDLLTQRKENYAIRNVEIIKIIKS